MTSIKFLPKWTHGSNKTSLVQSAAYQSEDGLRDVWLDADPEPVPAAAAGDRGLAAVRGTGIGVVIRNLMSGGMRRVTRNCTLFEIMGGIQVFHCQCSWTLTSPKQAAHPRAVNQLLVCCLCPEEYNVG